MVSGNVAQLNTKGEPNPGEYPFAHTRAARMFREGLDKYERATGTSQRQLAKLLGYKTSVVISHMSLGRAPIPVERSKQFARTMGMDVPEFMAAVLEQRFPELDFYELFGGGNGAAPTKGMKVKTDEETMVLEDLQAAAGKPLADLSPDHFAVLRRVAAEPQASRRWMSVEELGVVELMRTERPDLLRAGLTPMQRKQLKEAVIAL